MYTYVHVRANCGWKGCACLSAVTDAWQSHLWLEGERVAMVLLQVLGQWRRKVRTRRRRVSALAVQNLAERAEQEDTGIPATNSGGGVHVIDVGATFDDAFDALLMASVGFVRSTRGRRLRSLRAGL